MHRTKLGMVALGIGLALVSTRARPAAAAIDLNGNFRVEVTVPIFFSAPLGCSVNFVQTGAALSASGTCDFVGAVTLPTGTIDSASGVFTLSGSSAPLCPTLSLAGTASNSSNFAGTLTCAGSALPPIAGTMIGSRCGNGQPDPGEQCDDGNFLNGDCCSSTCQYEPAGSGCAPDFNGCTNDVCNGAGFCTHPNNTAPCDDGSDCTTGDVCGGGSCHGAFVASGTACDDSDPCTVGDQCDGAGTCAPGSGTLDCGTCMTCVGGFGCSAVGTFPTDCKVPILQASPLSINDRTPDSHDKLVWKLTKGTATDVADFGDPRSTTSYKLCLFDQEFGIGYDNAIFAADIQAGGTCGGSPCWIGTSKGYKYKNKTGNGDGILQVLLVAGPRGKTKIAVVGKGGNLHPPVLPINLTQPILMQLRNDNGECWQAQYVSAFKNTPVAFKSKGGSPSGAFLTD